MSFEIYAGSCNALVFAGYSLASWVCIYDKVMLSLAVWLLAIILGHLAIYRLLCTHRWGNAAINHGIF